MASIYRECHLRRHDRGPIRLDGQATHRSDRRASHPRRSLDHACYDLSNAGHRIAPEVHWHCTRMIGTSTHLDYIVAGTSDSRNDPDREVRLLEYRTLLNVELDEGIDISALGFRDTPGIQPEKLHRLAYGRFAFVVPQRIWLVGPDAPGHGTRTPEVSGREPA